jgi:hypothetical protein
MVDSPEPRTRRDALIDRLVADARPVRPLWPPPVRLALWLVLAVVVVLSSVTFGVRPDLRDRLHDPGFLFEVLALFLAAIVAAGLALAAAVPGRGPGRRQFAVTMIVAAILWLVPVRYPAEAGQSLDAFLGMAMACERRTVLLAMAPLGGLLAALHRGAPLAGAMAGSLAAAAAFLLAAANMRVLCPADGRFHLLVGHALPAVGGIGLCALLGTLWLRRWRHAGRGGTSGRWPGSARDV